MDNPQASDILKQPIRVLVVDDHAIVRRGVRALLATESDIRVVGEAQNGQEAIDLTDRTAPDVILMDLVMPVMDGLQAIRQILSRWPQVRILVLTSFTGVDKIMPAIKAGALGYLLKDSGPEELVRAIREVFAGNAALHPAIARQLLGQVGELQEQDLLTDREREVLRLIALGRCNQEIAAELVVSEATIRSYVSHIVAKLGLADRTQAALYALRTGLASLDEVDVNHKH